MEFSLVILSLLVSGLFCYFLRIPSAIGFLIAGVVLGPFVLKLVDKSSAINQIGSAGVVLLLFFLGMEFSPNSLIKNWKITVVGTLLQVVISVLVSLGLGYFLSWPINRSILIGFVISLSSTVMVIKLLNDRNLVSTPIGRDVLGILVVQDIIVVPMLIIVGLMGDAKPEAIQFFKQTLGCFFLVLSYLFVPRLSVLKNLFELSKYDAEIKVLFCLSFAFGMASLTGLLELSTALGAFVAGGIIAQLNLGEVFHHSLDSIKHVLIALFFSTIGLLLDLDFFYENYFSIIGFTVVAILTNTFINAIILRMNGRKMGNSLIASAYLSQIGEFSFILAAIGLQQKVINEFSYQFTIFIIFLSIILTPPWVKLMALISKPEELGLVHPQR